MREVGAAVLLATAACYSPHPPAGAPCGPGQACPSGLTCTAQGQCEPPGSGPPDASGFGDAPPDTPAACVWSTHFFDGCSTPTPQGDLDFDATSSPWTIDTDAMTIRGRHSMALTAAMTTLDQNGTPALIVSVNRLIIEANVNVRVIGSRPLVVAAHQTISIDGALDVGGHHAQPGAGGNPAQCSAATMPGTGADGASNTIGGGGGGGGAFQGAGGHGGALAGTTTVDGGAGGAARLAPPMLVRGGCGGGAGGDGGGGAGPSGAGGGAVQLTAHDSITISSTGSVAAGGGGGGAGTVTNGAGGGGGAGGYIGLEAPVITCAGQLAANGGGGGGGAGTTAPTTSSNGALAETGSPGGTNATCGSPGGDGSSRTNLPGRDVTTSGTCGGGGGGGGAGFIVVFGPSASVSLTGLVSPGAMTNPF